MDVDLEGVDRYAALRARDARFDGVFFVGVRTTGIYCRPICPARLPKQENCTFFRTAAEAEREGYRACLRCRPERAPGLASVDARSRLAGQAADRIRSGYLNHHRVGDLAKELDVSARHLRRVLQAELGVGPVELAQTRRLAVAKQLLQDTSLPMSRVAFASGFSSIRRFNAVFSERFDRPPSVIRRGSARSSGTPETVPVRLDYRPPLAWHALLRFLEKRATPGVEAVRGNSYLRFVSTRGGPGNEQPGHAPRPSRGHPSGGEHESDGRRGSDSAGTGHRGWVTVQPVPDRPSLEASIPIGLVVELPDIVQRLRHLFDLDARPAVVAEHLKDDPILGPRLDRHPGLRVPGAYDPFELAIRTIIGQQITVEAATSLCGRFVRAFGNGAPEPTADGADDASEHASDKGAGPTGAGRTFPDPVTIAALSTGDVSALGMPETRARAIVELARAIRDDGLALDPTADPRETARHLATIPGVGPWTVQYVLMRAVRWPNAFPAGDLGIRRALGGITRSEAERCSRTWEPWRAYAAVHLWNRTSTGAMDDA